MERKGKVWIVNFSRPAKEKQTFELNFFIERNKIE